MLYLLGVWSVMHARPELLGVLSTLNISKVNWTTNNVQIFFLLFSLRAFCIMKINKNLSSKYDTSTCSGEKIIFSEFFVYWNWCMSYWTVNFLWGCLSAYQYYRWCLNERPFRIYGLGQQLSSAQSAPWKESCWFTLLTVRPHQFY